MEQQDIHLSRQIYNSVEHNGLLKTLCRMVEWCVHGVPWLLGVAGTLVYVVLYTNGHVKRYWFQHLACLFVYLVADGILVGGIKVLFRRPRPFYSSHGDMRLGAPVADHYSFPSGHCTRAAMLLMIMCSYEQLEPYTTSASILVSVVAISRVALGRHYVSDVIAGLAIGTIQGLVYRKINIDYNFWMYGLGMIAIGDTRPFKWMFDE